MTNSWYVLAFALICLAIWFLFDLTSAIRDKSIQKTEMRMRREKVVGRKSSRWSASRERHNRLLRITGMSRFGLYVLTVGSLLFGFIAGKLMFQDTFLSIATSAVFIAVPSIYLEIQAGKQQVYEAEKLENALSIITNTFLSSGDIVSAVKNNLDLLELRKPFEEFYIDVSFINANVEHALLRLASKYPSVYLSQWVDAVILSQQDRKMMYILPSIINQMNDMRQDQMEAATALVTIWRDYITLLLLICAIPIVFRIVLYEWYAILVGTNVGRMFCLGLIVSILFSLKKAIKINRPINI